MSKREEKTKAKNAQTISKWCKTSNSPVYALVCNISFRHIAFNIFKV